MLRDSEAHAFRLIVVRGVNEVQSAQVVGHFLATTARLRSDGEHSQDCSHVAKMVEFRWQTSKIVQTAAM